MKYKVSQYIVDGTPSMYTQMWMNVQASMDMASRLGWSLDSSGTAGEIDPDSCTDKIHGLFVRAQYYKLGKVQEKDSGKAFVPDWDGLAKQDPVQGQLTESMVCAQLLFS